jgi:hypothetical protein
MNKNVKYGIYFALAALGTYGLVRVLKKRNEPQSPYAPDAAPPATSGGLQISQLSKSLDKNKTLSQGSTGLEVKEMQRQLGVTQDGIFGPLTLQALQSKAGVSSTTLANLPSQISAVSARASAAKTDATMKSMFPIGKSVTAAVDFNGAAYINRNNDWYSTDSNGNNLPRKQFKKTADLGTVYAYPPSYPGWLIIKLSEPIDDDYPYMGVKSTWVR